MIAGDHSMIAEELSDEAEYYSSYGFSVKRVQVDLPYSFAIFVNLPGDPHQTKGNLHDPSNLSNGRETSPDEHTV